MTVASSCPEPHRRACASSCRWGKRAAAWCSAILLASALGAQAQAGDPAASATDARVIVKLKPGAKLLDARSPAPATPEKARAEALGKHLGLALRTGRAVAERTQVVIAPAISAGALAELLARDADVEYAVPDERRTRLAVPNDPLYAAGVPGNGPAVGQWYLRAPGGEVAASIDAEAAWNITIGNPAVIVAVLDTGVRFEHPDLRSVASGGNLMAGYDMISDPAQANDNDSRDTDASDPGDFVTVAEANTRGPFFQCTTLDPSTGKYLADDSSWHGTQVSGIIAALTDNAIGMASVARNVRILPVRVLGKCGGFDSDIIAGMRWAAGLAVPGTPANANRAQVINMSLGAPGTCSAAYKDAVNEIAATGSVIVASAGNSTGHAVSTPANCPGILAVAGLRHVGTKVGFSDLGAEVALSAPGGNCINIAPGSECIYPILTTANSGQTSPVASIYTDSFNPSLGTSFSAPLVSGTVALMLSVQPTLTTSQVRQLLQATARPFPTTGGDNGDGTIVPACTLPQFDSTGKPIDQSQCYCTTQTCGAGMLDAGAAVLAAKTGMVVPAVQAEGLWWNAPANSEPGWGLNLAQQGDVIFATWFTYDANGKAWWLSMTAQRTVNNLYTGTLYQTHGPAFNAVPFDPARVSATAVGTATLAFSDVNNGSFSYTVNGISASKSITRQVFGRLPTCTFGKLIDLSLAASFQDLWWNAPAGSEAGWGLNITQQGDVIFATWFTYDLDGSPLWLSFTAPSTGPRTYSGTLYRNTGPRFDGAFSASPVTATAVGTAKLTFTDGNTAMFAYTVNDTTQVKNITRQVFRAPGTVCE